MEDINESELKMFKEDVKQWIVIDKEIKELKDKIKSLSKQRDSFYKPKLTEFMTKSNIETLNTSSGKITLKKRTLRGGLNKKKLIEKLSVNFEDTNKAKSIVNEIYDSREAKETISLLRTIS